MNTQALHVLIVDDDIHAARLLGRIVEREGHKVTLLFDPTDAIRLVRKLAIDVIIADERMPGITGADILATLARLEPHTFRVLTSCNLDVNGVIDRVNRARIDYLLKKPFRIADVCDLLRTATNEWRPMERSVPSYLFGSPSLKRDSTGAILLPA